MLIGAHVSTAGGLVNAHGRAVEIGCEAMQVFNQSPRQWRPTRWKPDDISAFCELMEDGPIKTITVHAVYLINLASKDPEVRGKSLDSLVHSLRMGDEIGAQGVVIHPGSTLGEPHDESIERVGEALRHGLGESDDVPLLLENTAGGGNTLGRSFEELAAMLDAAGAPKRLGVCLDSCHMLASGFDIRTADKLSATIDRCVELVGLERVQCLHMNDSKTKLGSNSDRHAPPGDGELGPRGCAAFLSEPRFEGLPTLFEGPGVAGKAAAKEDLDRMKELRRNGLRSRRRRARS